MRGERDSRPASKIHPIATHLIRTSTQAATGPRQGRDRAAGTAGDTTVAHRRGHRFCSVAIKNSAPDVPHQENLPPAVG